MAYANDVFISYSHEDVAWARRLEADLQARDAKLRIFRDETRLYAGDIWRSELQKNIMEAQHLAVVWSDKAKQSGWVNAELSWFLTYTNQATDRKVLCLLLQGTNPAYDPHSDAAGAAREECLSRRSAEPVTACPGGLEP
jgi:hypothetical protein